ncbi:propionate catabolism activator [Lucifera butyrica]|uniref:Propionate catabolism activator n=1 Tax=Lucifera butyrica TaxID=1351585 RepID=A0A498R4X5_9FIRM|nr:sigma-54-dependent Fis family transcriptional regulator [Lucifera butyrica]VBB07746.1 propionate catabolism activator [Lucifera butyrica]
MDNLNGSLKAEPVRLALIYTYPKMAETFSALAKQENLKPYVAFAALDEAAAIAKEIEPNIDAILSRGGTAEYIKQAVSVPVISIPITPFDAVKSINSIKDIGKKIALFNYGSNMYGIRDIENMFNATIREYTFFNEQEIEAGIINAKSHGIEIVIGGIITINLAEQHGLKGVLIESGEEAVYRSMIEAIHIVEASRMERRKAVRFKAVLDSIAEGIIFTDDQNRVIVYNPAAERIFRLPERAVVGSFVQETIPNTRMHTVFETGKSELGELQEIHGGIIATSRSPIFLDGKPIGVVSVFEDITKIQQLEQQIRKQIHAKGFVAKHRFQDILTVNPQVSEVKELAALYATTDSSVLIEGESGTGKELFAQSIHNASKRAGRPFVAVNCAAIPEYLLESELFGYESGAFTGAKKGGKQGLFELAHNGTIFLDEIGEIPKALQARLLRVLQEKEIMRVGGDKLIPVDIRIISATNKNLESKIEQGEFRDDLYYRLNVFSLKLLPLRERKEDIPLLASSFLQQLNAHADYELLEKELAPALKAYNWPGNIRELRNICERLALLLERPEQKLTSTELFKKVMNVFPVDDGDSLTVRIELEGNLKQVIDSVEKKILDYMLEKYGRDQDAVAKRLGIGRTTLWRKINT